MKQTFTLNHLLLAAYGELPSNTAMQMHQEMEQDVHAANEMQHIIDMQEILDGLQLKPSRTSVNIILDYSRQTADSELIV